jgi:hypothetical protein
MLLSNSASAEMGLLFQRTRSSDDPPDAGKSWLWQGRSWGDESQGIANRGRKVVRKWRKRRKYDGWKRWEREKVKSKK